MLARDLWTRQLQVVSFATADREHQLVDRHDAPLQRVVHGQPRSGDGCHGLDAALQFWTSVIDEDSPPGAN